MNSSELRQKYLKFFEEKGHKIIPSAPLVPENDPTTLFVSSGMQPLVPYLLGQPHPMGARLVNSQKSFRAEDIEEVGDNRHTTFFEMLGNWSLGDYWKKEQLEWIFEYLVEVLKLDPSKLYVTTFAGDPTNNIPQDGESTQLWKNLFAKYGIEAKDIERGTVDQASEYGMEDARIIYYGSGKNWWSRSGIPENMPEGEPGGPDSEIFYDFGLKHDEKYGKYCHPNCDCGRFLEIGNSVFMQYKKEGDHKFSELPKKNVDFGGGFERQLAAVSNEPDIFKTELFTPIFERINEQTGLMYGEDDRITQSLRIIADHIRASTFLIKSGVTPSNKLQGYILRRLIRRAAIKLYRISKDFINVLPKLVDPVIDTYKNTDYFETGDWDQIRQVVSDEIRKFGQTLENGLKEVDKRLKKLDSGWLDSPENAAKFAFDLFQTYGLPMDAYFDDLLEKHGFAYEWGYKENLYKEFEKLRAQHSELSRTSSSGMFKGGLSGSGEVETKYHTATHLLHTALRNILGPDVQQKGSNITPERLRFDFSYPEKLTQEQIKQIEELINQKISEDLPVTVETMSKTAALSSGALAFFPERYPETVTVYTVKDFSREICMGPHVKSTGEIGEIKITKEEALGSGVRRIYATLSAS